MCGIGGYIGEHEGLDERALLAGLRHRGPDAEGQATLPLGMQGDLSDDRRPRVHLCFARLAILDLSPAGNQPMASEDGVHTLIYNGETYNFAALRDELRARGHRFRSTSDTEVVLHGYREWGAGVVERLRGMFAFAVWDAKSRRLQIFRDRLGIKPLYYHHDGRRLVFASELSALLASNATTRRLHPRSVHGYLAFGSVPQPDTLVSGVSLLLPGHVLTVEAGRGLSLSERPYFHLPAPPSVSVPGRRVAPPDAAARAHAAAELAPLLLSTVGQHLVADVPVGVLLSGGIDSTAVAELARRARPEGDLHSFTLTYGADQKESEGAEARRLSEALRFHHHEKIEDPAGILSRLPAYLGALDQPSVDGLNTYLVAQVVKDAGLKVALSGLGGDELFLGYDLRKSFAAGLRLGPAAARLPFSGPLSRLFSSAVGGRSLGLGKGAAVLAAVADGDARRPPRALRLYAALRGLFPAAQLGDLLDPDLGLCDLDPAAHLRCDLPPDRLPHLLADELLSYLEIGNYLGNTLLRDADVMSMVHGVELRVPLCDHVLVSRVMSLPAGMRVAPKDPGAAGTFDLYPQFRKKPLFVDACQSDLVDVASERQKRGFVLPLDSWLRAETGPTLRGLVGQLLRDPAAARAAGLRHQTVSSLWQEYEKGRAKGAQWRIWALHMLLTWVQQHGLTL